PRLAARIATGGWAASRGGVAMRSWSRGFALLAVGLLAVAACGDDGNSSSPTTQGSTGQAPTTRPLGGGGSAASSTTAPSADKIDPNAILRVPIDLSSNTSGQTFDPAKAFSGGPVMTLVYDSLLRPTPDGGVEPGLAESVKLVDPTTIDIVLK